MERARGWKRHPRSGGYCFKSRMYFGRCGVKTGLLLINQPVNAYIEATLVQSGPDYTRTFCPRIYFYVFRNLNRRRA